MFTLVTETVYYLLSFFCLLSPTISIIQKPELRKRCFDQRTYEWDMRAKITCDREELYHCLQHYRDSKTFYEFCETFVYISPGTYPVYNPSIKLISGKICPENTYQDRLLRSSDLNSCDEKTECTRKGSLVCDDGSASEDRTCKCDVTTGMIIPTYDEQLNNSDICCPKSDPDCMCWRKACQTGKELNEVYQCVTKCKPGFYRPNWKSKCASYRPTYGSITTENPVTSLPTLPTDNPETRDSVTNTGPSNNMAMKMTAITMEVILGLLVVIVVLMVGKYLYKYKNKIKNRRSLNNVERSEEEQSIQLLPARDINNHASAAGDGDAVASNEGHMQVLFDVVACHLPSESTQLGVYLGLTSNEIDAIKEEHKLFLQEQIFQILWKWFSKNNNRDHVRDLNNILSQKLSRNDIVRELAEFSMAKFDYRVNGEENGMKKITEEDCLDVSLALTRDTWKLLRFLSLKQMTIDRIRTDYYNNIQTQTFTLLIAWTQKDLNCTRNKLCSGLNYINRNDIINNLETRWGIDTPENASL